MVLEGDGEVGACQIFSYLGKYLKYVCLVTVTVTLLTAIVVLKTPNEYRSTALLIGSSRDSGKMSGLVGQFGGLAAMAGINLSGAPEGNTLIAMEVIKTWGFLEEFIEAENISVDLFAVKSWDGKTGKLEIDPSLYDPVVGEWVRSYDASIGESAEPSSWELYEELRGRVFIAQDNKTGIVSLSVEHYSPLIAKEWTEKLIYRINEHFKEKDKAEAEKNIDYLNRKIQDTNIREMRSVFYQLIEEQSKTLMLAEISEEYVFKVVSNPKVAEDKTKPKRALIVGIGFFLSLCFSIFVVLVKGLLEIENQLLRGCRAK